MSIYLLHNYPFKIDINHSMKGANYAIAHCWKGELKKLDMDVILILNKIKAKFTQLGFFMLVELKKAHIWGRKKL